MGAVGPTQLFVFVNGRLRTFNKTTGVADNVLNADPDNFFSSVMTPPTSSNFTSDPQVRYDRLTARWILLIIDVPNNGTSVNRVLLAVSDAASAGVISNGTVWTYYFVQQDTVGGASSGEFLDYPSLGVDANALYVGGVMFGASSGSFTGTNGYVIRKSSILNGGPIVTTAFRSLATATGEGPFAPRGVDNYDPNATEGYFVGTSNAALGRLVTRRITSAGATPSISANLLTTVSTTSNPILVPHVGNTGGNNGRLDALDDRLFAAHIRNGRLWTAHNIAVNASGVSATSGTTRRNAARWYELNVPTGTATPTVNQSGTIFDSTATNPRNYWIPSVMISGQGHAAFAFSFAGLADNPGVLTAGRLSNDALGTTQAATTIVTSGGVYNPPSDPGGAGGRRWGDYSYVSLDPKDDMTMWAVGEFCSSANTYGLRVAKLIAPPPATPNTTGARTGNTSQNVTINGTSTNGSGFYDPGANLASPALPFNHIAASVSGTNVVVNSVTYVNPTQIILNLNTTGAATGSRTMTITNPDGQSNAGTLVIQTTTAANVSVSGRILTKNGRGIKNAVVTLTDSQGRTRTTFSSAFGVYRFDEVAVDETHVINVASKRFVFSQSSTAISPNENIENLNFTAQ